ncbi:uncharacterized protein G2W53_022541 [Senna tora]|uniref:Uncharacterized protein n=1 Tax=Senna tora TaxID=362788 RepID=A0A834TMM3_9FABA|nr:uncharacterized protein G2W53_022541 [Senna tora]
MAAFSAAKRVGNVAQIGWYGVFIIQDGHFWVPNKDLGLNVSKKKKDDEVQQTLFAATNDNVSFAATNNPTKTWRYSANACHYTAEPQNFVRRGEQHNRCKENPNSSKLQKGL